MLAPLEGYDWAEAFGFAGEPDTNCLGGVSVEAIPGSPSGIHGPFTREDVEVAFALMEGEHDESDWIAVVRLKDGRFASVSAGCDYTGWDCRASGRAYVGDDLENLIRFGLDNDQRRRIIEESNARHIEPGFAELVREVVAMCDRDAAQEKNSKEDRP
jgi:hypothetical protein